MAIKIATRSAPSGPPGDARRWGWHTNVRGRRLWGWWR
jgi:hypothetical protein